MKPALTLLPKSALLAAALSALLGTLPSFAVAQATPAGLWKTIDDDGKTEKSLVRITETGGTFSGRIEKILDPARQDARCDKCRDERKDQPVQGLTIIRHVKASADDPGLWDGGEILDPSNGKTYRVRLKPAETGRKLDVRGYIGTPLLGRTQTWVRVE